MSTALLIADDCESIAAPDGIGEFQGELAANSRPTAVLLPVVDPPVAGLPLDVLFVTFGLGVLVGFGLRVDGLGVGTGIDAAVLASANGAVLLGDESATGDAPVRQIAQVTTSATQSRITESATTTVVRVLRRSGLTR